VRILLFGAMLRQEIAWFDADAHNSGTLSTRLSTDAIAGEFSNFDYLVKKR
jgi:hypothetical protein